MSTKTDKEHGKCLLQAMRDAGLSEYGSVILRSFVQEITGIIEPEFGTRADFQKVALKELAVSDYVRNVLLGEGKYLTAIPTGYRILLPSENAKQVERYMGAADGKLRRAMKLAKNSPQGDFKMDNDIARIASKRLSIKRQKEQSDLIGRK